MQKTQHTGKRRLHTAIELILLPLFSGECPMLIQVKHSKQGLLFVLAPHSSYSKETRKLYQLGCRIPPVGLLAAGFRSQLQTPRTWLLNVESEGKEG